MSSHTILIVYGTRYGQTKKIAERMRLVLGDLGYTVAAYDAADFPHGIDVREFGGIIVGASVIRGRHQATVRHFIEHSLSALNDIPSAFYSVSGAAGEHSAEAQAGAQRVANEFVAACGWHPSVTTTVAGALAYPSYSPIMRWVMKRIAARTGRSTDTSTSHEYTDWPAVDRFAHAFGDRVAQSTADRAATTLTAR